MTVDDLILLLFVMLPAAAGGCLFYFALFRISRQRQVKRGWSGILAINLTSLIVLVGLTLAGGELYCRFVFTPPTTWLAPNFPNEGWNVASRPTTRAFAMTFPIVAR